MYPANSCPEPTGFNSPFLGEISFRTTEPDFNIYCSSYTKGNIQLLVVFNGIFI